MHRVLDDILTRKREEVAKAKASTPRAQLEAMPGWNRKRHSLFAALSEPNGNTRIIAEVKRASPSAGTFAQGLDAVAQAGAYVRGGAAAISVLTDGPGFGGSLQDLRDVSSMVAVPVLRKDFIVDAHQLFEAKAHGADVVLLIVAALEQPVLAALHEEARALGLEVLVEVHDAAELERALALKPKIVGVNNRNLQTFEVSIETSKKLLPGLPAGVKGVAESGVKGWREVASLREVGIANFLVGEALVRASAPETAVRELSEGQ